jgi:hypothetical protein
MNSGVGMEMKFVLDDRGIGIRFLVAARYFSFNDSVQNVFGTDPASYPLGAGALSSVAKWDGRYSDAHLELVPRLRVLHLYPHSSMSSCSGKTQGQLQF